MPLADDIVARLIDLERRMQRQEAKETPRFVTSTWTPAFQGETSNGTISYTAQAGRYVRLGSLVYASAIISVNVVTAAPTNFLWVSLPFAVATTDGNVAVSLGLYRNLNITPGVQVLCYTNAGLSRAVLVETADNASETVLPGTALQNGAVIIYTAVYEGA